MVSIKYLKAIVAFQEHFKYKNLLIEVYAKEFLKLVNLNVRANKKRLSFLESFNKLEVYLRSLESKGSDTDKNEAQFYSMIESSLSDNLLKAW